MSIQLINNTPTPKPEDQFEVSKTIRNYADDKVAIESGGLNVGDQYYDANGFVRVVMPTEESV